MLTTIIVTDQDDTLADASLKSIGFNTYLHQYPKLGEPKIRVINLCDTDRYLSQGYYCSLLAEAREHQVLPTIKVINSLRASKGSFWLDAATMGKKFNLEEPGENFIVCMGEAANKRHARVAHHVFSLYPAPLLTVQLSEEGSDIRVEVKRVGLADMGDADREFCLQVLTNYSQSSWRQRGSRKKYRWDMVMLVDPEEKVPPSDENALRRFVKAGEKLGIQVHTLAASQIFQLNQFDALFIRETTAIDHHTYRLATKAEEQGLVVIDDPTSILRCCNKVFLHDAFSYRKVPSLRTQIISDLSKETVAQLENNFSYPIVLKMPEGSFSRGVFKVANTQELVEVAGKMLQDSALVLAQEYLFTEYDWRVGVLNGRALYACRYHMARNHWQIYNHESKQHFSGGFDTLPTFEVPRKVLDAALKAAAVIGDSLYGIDIKEHEGKAYVLEVNDNPSIDQGVEDKYLGKELYMQIMSEFLRRMELRGH